MSNNKTATNSTSGSISSSSLGIPTGDIPGLGKLNGVGCLVAENATIGILLPPSNVYSCQPGFYCPRVNPDIKESLPTQCPPTISCMALRLSGFACPPQGKYEPLICPSGNFCPDFKTLKACPKGSYCLTGSTKPKPCPYFSMGCDDSATTPRVYLGVVLCILCDVLILTIAIFVKMRELKRNGQSIKFLIPFYSKFSQISKKDGVEDIINWDDSLYDSNVKHKYSLDNGKGLFIQERTVSKPSFSQKRFSHERQSDLVNFFKKGLNNQELHMNFRFNDLGLKLKNGKELLKGVTGDIKAGRMTAIMGPSGAGKTTFMSVLMGKVQGTSGTLQVNGRPSKMHTFKHVIGHVPQEDIMLRELTVKENVMHSAKCRLPCTWTSKQVEAYVDAILDCLNLTHVAHTMIGDETRRGISGGQRKRVNIALELAAIPLAMFLDEPTSGLDSTSALQVCQILSKISKLGITVVSVIHQPRVEIFKKFDDVLLIAPGGKTTYFGPVDRVQEYFQNLGFVFDAEANPADVLMDILSGKTTQVGTRPPFTPKQLVEIWKDRGIQYAHRGASTTREQDDLFHKEIQPVLRHRGARFYSQIYYCFMRSLLQQMRTLSSYWLEIFVGSFAGLIMGLSLMSYLEIYQGVWIKPYTLMSPAPNNWLVAITGLLIGMAIALAAAPAGVKVFGEEKTVYWREASSGHDRFSYFVGKCLGSIPRMTVSALHFASFLHFVARPVISFEIQFVIVLLQFFGVYGLSAIISMVVRRENTTLLAVVLCLFAAVFCGAGPTLYDARQWGISFIWDMSYNRWAAEAQFSEYLTPYRNVYMIEETARVYEYKLGQVGFDLLMMTAIGMVHRVIAFILLILLKRDKQR